jgi:putative transposase
MKTTHKSDSQIMQILSQAGSGVPVMELCREHGMSSATFYTPQRGMPRQVAC